MKKFILAATAVASIGAANAVDYEYTQINPNYYLCEVGATFCNVSNHVAASRTNHLGSALGSWSNPASPASRHGFNAGDILQERGTDTLIEYTGSTNFVPYVAPVVSTVLGTHNIGSYEIVVTKNTNHLPYRITVNGTDTRNVADEATVQAFLDDVQSSVNDPRVSEGLEGNQFLFTAASSATGRPIGRITYLEAVSQLPYTVEGSSTYISGGVLRLSATIHHGGQFVGTCAGTRIRSEAATTRELSPVVVDTTTSGSTISLTPPAPRGPYEFTVYNLEAKCGFDHYEPIHVDFSVER